jgi:hypothetical protein
MRIRFERAGYDRHGASTSMFTFFILLIRVSSTYPKIGSGGAICSRSTFLVQ